jgi:hypothetical protein
MRAYIALAAFLLAVSAPFTALAWTEARLSSVSASLDVQDASVARVSLELRLLVRAGWLSSLDLDGLDPDLELLEVLPPTGASAPVVNREAPGRLQLRWEERRGAPRRGEHLLRIVYTTRQPFATARVAGTQRVSWTLPRWPVRLSDVRVTVIGPAGLAASQREPNFGEHVELHAGSPGAASTLTFTRAELPRTEAYRVSFELPPPAADGGKTSRFAPFVEIRRHVTQNSWPALFGVCLGLLVIAKRRLRRSRAQSSTLLLPWLEPRSIDIAAFALCAAAPVLLDAAPTLALLCALLGVASALERKHSRHEAPGPQRTAATPPERSKRFASIHAVLDATTPAGVTCLGALLAAGTLAPEPWQTTALICAWLATPLFFNGTQLAAKRLNG